jgi:uncharacterized membrane protein
MASAASAPAAWVVTELPTLGGTGGAEAWGINDSGVLCGHGYDADEVQFAFRYNGAITLLPHLEPANPHSVSRAINSNGVVVGFSYNATGRERAVFWEGTTITEIPTPAGIDPDRSMSAQGINNAGVIVGHYFDNEWFAKPFYYDGAMHDLAPVLAAAGLTGRSYAKDVNNHGVICGHAQGAVYNFWTYDITTGTFAMLGTLTPFLTCTAAAINDAGHVVGRGQSSFTSPFHALLHDGSFQILDSAVTDTQWAWNVNNLGRVIGTARVSDAPDYSWYSDGPGAGSLVRLDLPGVDDLTIKDINDDNVIVGYGLTATSGDSTRAIIIAPPPGDGDGDGDVDLHDFGGLMACFAPAGPVGPACRPFDIDRDADVDLADYAVFEAAIDGPH